MLNQFAVEILTLPVNLCYSTEHPAFEGLLRPSFESPRRKEGPPNIWDTSGISGNVFANPQASSSAPTLFGRKLLRNRFTCLQRKRVIDQNEIKI